jgi:predicted metal-dependent hydrolase
MATVQIGSLEVELNRKAIKNLHISVLPPNGRIRVSAPTHLSDTAIRTAVIQRIPWIRRQQKDFAAQPRQSERRMVSGETHYLWGRRYRLTVIEREGKQEVVPHGNTRLRLYVRPGADLEARSRVMSQWYRTALRERTGGLIGDWQVRIGVTPSAWGIKQMKTKWGSCNTSTGSIWLNLELAKKPPECLEFILVHELVHLRERHHNDHFLALMDQHLPKWREYRAGLNRSPLGHADWEY